MNEPYFSATLQSLMEEFSRSGVRELHLRSGDFEIYLSNDPAARGPAVSRLAPVARPLAPTAAAPSVSAPAALPEDAIIIRAPNLGTFYRAPKPGADNYVELGSTISVGDEVCLIEVMKLFTAVRVEEAGTVHAILAPDGAMVEAGQPLFALVRN
ncbi:biotin/lipoyl-containing protein [Sphingobium sp.]|uniref:acetyl-CoA carboxylase biotin carboxyl carrier protein n=1 Tax=Sphingobium sp. TaxID=1912891 RepID=UPI0028BE0E09|nr:biotin/lipoyl-containing protein [Sphingobium sp.]